MDMGNRIAARRKALNLTLSQVARVSGLSAGAISDLEHGRQHSTTKLHHLARALDCNLQWLETGHGPIEPDATQPRSYYHGPLLSQDALHVAAQWDRLVEPARSQTRAMIDSFVTVQLREAQKQRAQNSTPPPPPRNKVPSR